MTYILEVVYRQLSYKPKTSRQIAAETGLKDVEIRNAIRQLRFDGYKICSGSKGFWFWNGEDDTWHHTLNHIKSRAMAELELYSAMAKQPIEGQINWDLSF